WRRGRTAFRASRRRAAARSNARFSTRWGKLGAIVSAPPSSCASVRQRCTASWALARNGAPETLRNERLRPAQRIAFLRGAGPSSTRVIEILGQQLRERVERLEGESRRDRVRPCRTGEWRNVR